MAFKDYDEFAADPLVLPIGGKRYEIPPLAIDAGLVVFGAFNGTDKSLAKRPLHEMFSLIMGGAWEQMRADGVSLEAATRAGWTVFADITEGRAVAEIVWESGFDPKAITAFLSERASKPSTSSASAKRTPRRASTTRTTSQKATPRAVK